MKFIINNLALLAILVASTSYLLAQSPSDRYIHLADGFKQNAQPDSALLYYDKASLEFQKLGDFEKLANAYNQMGVILTRQDKYESANHKKRC